MGAEKKVFLPLCCLKCVLMVVEGISTTDVSHSITSHTGSRLGWPLMLRPSVCESSSDGERKIAVNML